MNTSKGDLAKSYCYFCKLEPKIFFKFPCGHLLCEKCTQTKIISSCFKKKLINPFTFNCSLCKTSKLEKTPIEILDFLNKISSSKGICKKHNYDYENYCPKCRLWLCKECKSKFHDEYFSQHQLSDSDAKEEDNKCEFHHELDKNFYCKDCKISLCKQCALKDHKVHWIISFTDYEEQFQKNYTKLKFKTFEDAKKEIETSTTNTENSINDDYNQVCSKIEKTISSLKQFLSDLTKIKEKKIEELHTYSKIIKKVYSTYFSEKERKDKNIQSIRMLDKIDSEFSNVFYDKKHRDARALGKIDKVLSEILSVNIFPINFQFVSHENISPTRKDFLKCEGTIRSQTSWVNCLVELKDGQLATGGGGWAGSSDKTIRIYNIVTLKEDFKLKGHRDDVLSLVQLKDGRLASGSLDMTIKIWDLEIQKEVLTLTSHEGNVQCLIQLSDGRLASGSGDKTIKIWDTTFTKCHTLLGHTDRVRALIQLQDLRLASGSYDNTIIIWDINKMKGVFTLTEHVDDVYCLLQLADGRLASGSRDNTIKIWNLKSMSLEFSLSGHSQCVLCLTQLRDGRIVSGSGDKTIKVWKIDARTEEFTLEGHSDIVNSLIELRDGRLVSCSLDRTIKIWG